MMKRPQIDNRRRSGRVVCDNVESSLGSVLDVSPSGMRIRLKRGIRWREGQVFAMSLVVGARIVPVTVRVVRVVRHTFSSPEVGLSIQDPTPEVRSALASLACIGGASNVHQDVNIRVHGLVA